MWLGVDPGGKNAFGLVFLNEDGGFSSHLCSCAHEAIGYVHKRPAGIGIDAPMWWSSGPSGDRHADRIIRKMVPKSSTVMTPNSLRGAALIQGVIFAELVRRKFLEVPITETHPKAVEQIWPIDELLAFCNQYPNKGIPENEHIKDALVSAVAAREGFTGRWSLDLSQERNEYEQDPKSKSYRLAPMHYFWPDKS